MINDSAAFLPFLLSIFLSSLSGSFGHCIGMCGGIAIGINMKKNQTSSLLYKIFANIIYFLGRVSGYIIAGIGIFIVGSSLIDFNNSGNGIVFIILGILIILTSFIFTFTPRFLSGITPSGNYSWYKKFFKYALHSSNPFSYYLLGFLNGLLPCGFVYIHIISANSTGNIFGVAITMLVFGLGTFTSLFLIGIFGASFFSSRFREIFLKISFIIMIYLGGANIYKGYEMIANNSKGHHHHMMMPPILNKDTHNTHDHSDMHSKDSTDQTNQMHHQHMHMDTHTDHTQHNNTDNTQNTEHHIHGH